MFRVDVDFCGSPLFFCGLNQSGVAYLLHLVGRTHTHAYTIQDAKAVDTTMDPIQLGIFSHRFMSIAEQMGRALQRTSISTNIKERLDFSCALFGMWQMCRSFSNFV